MKSFLGLSASTALLASVFATVMGMSLPRAEASSSDEKLGYSVDGHNYSPEPPPVFDGQESLVPGDEVTGSLWIRNDRQSEIEVSVRPVAPDLSSRMYFETVSTSVVRLHPTQAKRFDLKIGLPWTADELSENRQEPSLQVLVEAKEAFDEVKPPAEPPLEDSPESPNSERDDELADTGFSALGLLIAVGLTALGTLVLGIRQKGSQAIAQRTEARNER